MMSKRKIYSLSYFLGRAFFLGFGYSLLLSMTDSDTWICFILGTLLGIILIYGISKIKEKMQKKTLKEYLNQKKILKYCILTLFFLFNLFIMSQILFILETFASSFFLINSPPFFILIPVIYLIFRITKKGWNTIGRISEIFMPVSLTIVLFSIIILLPYGTTGNFLPILTHQTSEIIKGSIFFACYSSAPFLLLLNAPISEPKLVRKYLFSTLTIFAIGTLIIAVLGPNLIQIYRYPEYMILKKIKVFEFLEKIENIISITWILDLLMILAMSGQNICDTIPKKHNRISFFILLLLLYIGVIRLGKIYHIELYIYYFLPMILGIFEVIIIAFLLLYQKIAKTKNQG